MKKIAFAATLAFAFPVVSASAQPQDIVQTNQRERWYYVSMPAGSPVDYTNRANSGVWSVSGTNLNHFQARASIFLMEFVVELPATITGPFEVTEAQITAFLLANPGWSNDVSFELFATGYRNEYPTPASFDIVTSPYVGGKNPPGLKDTRTPFLLGRDGSDADETTFPNTQRWALGVYDAASITPTNDNATPVTFTLDVSDPVIQARLQQDIANGQTRWFISADLLLAGFPSPPTPQFYHSVSTAPAAEAPQLVLRVQQTTSVADWMMMAE